jgi:hypothetical protein
MHVHENIFLTRSKSLVKQNYLENQREEGRRFMKKIVSRIQLITLRAKLVFFKTSEA